MLTRFLLVPILVMLAASPVLAKPTIIAELGSAPLLGSSDSTAKMRERVAGNARFVRQAARKLGLSSADYAEFSSAIADSRVAWVTVPRHLDAMSWRSGETVYVLRDVVIPAKTHGWEVDLHSGDQKIAVYMPAACGNVSVVRTAWPALAMHKPPVLPVVFASGPAVAVAEPDPPIVVPDDTVVAAPVAVASTEFPPAAVVHHSVIPFLAPLLLGIAALSGGSGSGPIAVLPDGCP